MKKIYFLSFTLLSFYFGQAQNINFPDPNLKSKLLLQGLDSNGDGEISITEASSSWVDLYLQNSGITNLEGLQFFTQMIGLYCQDNQITGTFDTSSWPYLQRINFSNNLLTTVNLVGSSAIELNFSNNPVTSFNMVPITGPFNSFNLKLNNTQITTLDLSNQPLLFEMECMSDDSQNSLLTTVNLSNSGFADSSFNINKNKVNILLTDGMHANVLSCSFNELTTLDLSGAFVNQLFCNDNHLTELAGLQIGRFSDAVLIVLNCQNNELQELDLSNSKNYAHMLQNNPLKRIFMKNNHDDFDFFEYLPTLEYVCVDESEANNFDEHFEFGAPFAYNSYCSFVPGGTFSLLSGNNHIDVDNNGCNVNDPIFPNLRYDITDGTLIGSVIADGSGHYQITVQDGSHTITPNLENPTYFNVSPASATVSFPATSSPYAQDFCITANGSHTDLEVVLVPINGARPGFISDYNLIYKNKGNTVESGTLTVAFDNTVSFLSASETISAQTPNALSWNFSDLQPFESRQILLKLQVNSPSQTPAVNAGMILNYLAAVNTDVIDETPDDNNFFLHQTVVNSFDPNDKTCLEGQTISAEDIGDYVHYQIRFENTGTADAQNIVVKDVIDANKFDINSLIPLDGSDIFYTRINGDTVEFIFENINLPFDDANNDGYVVFKIKTKPTLVVGDSFSNSASIYFDYNHPIVTEPALTTISVLKTKDFEFDEAFAIYPNPAANELNIQNKSNLEIQSIDIYNTLGQLVLAVTNAGDVSKVDVSRLEIGNYFIKINSDKGSSVAQFVKN